MNTDRLEHYAYQLVHPVSPNQSLHRSHSQERVDARHESQESQQLRAEDNRRQHTASGKLDSDTTKETASLQQPRTPRRIVSTTSRTNTSSRFTSPDRYAVSRSSLLDSPLSLHTSLSPHLLEGKERVHRRRLDNTSAFRSASESRVPRNRRVPTTERTRLFQPPHYNPSFVRTRDREQLNVETRRDGGLNRQVSTDGTWTTGGWHVPTGQIHGVDLGNGALTGSGSNAPLVNSDFIDLSPSDIDIAEYETRLALAMDIDTARRILPIDDLSRPQRHLQSYNKSQYRWFNGGWTKDYSCSDFPRVRSIMPRPEKVVPSIAFRVLDAPRLKDDYYCSILAYCCNVRTLAVALNHRVYLWTEKFGVRYPPLAPTRQNDYVTSLAFSSDEGRKAILAITRHSGSLTLWSLLEKKARFEVPHPSTTSVVAFKPSTTERKSKERDDIAYCEDLLVGDDVGRIYYYSVEWPTFGTGSITLLAKIAAHSQNVCGLAWAPHGGDFVSGGNDNSALLFNCEDVIQLQRTKHLPPSLQDASSSHDSAVSELHAAEATWHSPTVPGSPDSNIVVQADTDYRGRVMDRDHSGIVRGLLTPPLSPASGSVSADDRLADPSTPGLSHVHRHRFYHSAAVKAIAFAPWQSNLLATGGGSNDKQIHFHHTNTGTTLAIINVFAQVTSLVWSRTRREIVATFGYAQPEHGTRIAVFLWPSCECVVSIPWERKANGEVGRALWAIPYPGGPNDIAPERLQDPRGMQDTEDTGRAPTVRVNDHQDYLATRLPITPEASPRRRVDSRDRSRIRTLTRGEGERWASRTEEEGSLIIACCDQTVKFFEVWAGKSKGRSHALGSKVGVFGGSKVLEGWCEDVAIDEVGAGEHVIQ